MAGGRGRPSSRFLDTDYRGGKASSRQQMLPSSKSNCASLFPRALFTEAMMFLIGSPLLTMPVRLKLNGSRSEGSSGADLPATDQAVEVNDEFQQQIDVARRAFEELTTQDTAAF